MKYYVLDAETYWADDYTLSKMTPESYIRDERFKLHGWGVAEIDSDDAPMWLRPDDFTKWCKYANLEKNALVMHNARFDGAILGWRHGVKPRLWVDTMGMYRALHPGLRSYSLSNLGEYFKVGEKGKFLVNTRNKRDLTPDEWRLLGEYCLQDCSITAHLFNLGWPQFPASERWIMDTVLRMFIEPVFEVDASVLEEFLINHIAEKQSLLDRCGITKDDIMSSARFCALLRARGVVPPMKPSPADNSKRIPALAKTDQGMLALLEHDDTQVQMLAAARLGNKSTIMETRANHLIGISKRGTLPVPLNYWGAKVTGRLSGGDKINMQNFTRRSVLRKAVVAPEGHMLVVGDSSNIELRMVMALAGQTDQIEKIKYYDSIPEEERTSDLYCDFASDIYGRTITKADKDERFDGKTGMLSLQYMASDARFHVMLQTAGHPKAMAECTRIVRLYRKKHHKVAKLWYYCEETVIPAMIRGDVMTPVDVNGWFLTTGKGFALPGELGVQYERLHANLSLVGYSYWNGTSDSNIYGAKVVENLCQHAARQVLMYQMLLVRTRYPIKHQVHDEIVCCVPEDEAEECARFMLQCLSTAPPWTQGKLPVTGEVGYAKSYGDAK